MVKKYHIIIGDMWHAAVKKGCDFEISLNLIAFLSNLWENGLIEYREGLLPEGGRQKGKVSI